MSDHVLAPHYRDFAERRGLRTFAPVPCVIPGMTVRLAGDGPSSWAIYLNVARPTALYRWGTLPGAYISKKSTSGYIGSKSIDLMRAVVRDYSRAGDLVCDPCAGFATTGVAAINEGRAFIGSEIDEKAFDVACKRLSEATRQASLFEHSQVVMGGL